MDGTVKTYPIPNKITNFIAGIFGFDIEYELEPHTTQQKVLCKYNVIYHYSNGEIITSDTVTVLSQTNDSEDTLYCVQPFQVDGSDSSTGMSYIEVVIEANNLYITNFYSSSEEDTPSFIAYKAVELGASDNSVYIGTDGISLGKSCILHSSGVAELKDIKAEGGSIGGWILGNNSLYNGTNSLDSTTEGLYLGTDGIRNYSNDGKYININGGSINYANTQQFFCLGYSSDYALYGWQGTPNSVYHFGISCNGSAQFRALDIPGTITVRQNSGSLYQTTISGGVVNVGKMCGMHQDSEGGNIWFNSRSDTYHYELDAYSDTVARLYSYRNSDGYVRTWVFDANSGNFTADGCVDGKLSGLAQFRAVHENYGFMIRNDGSDTYFLLTNSGDPWGGWNGLRPLRIQNSNGQVFFEHLVKFGDGAQILASGSGDYSFRLTNKGNLASMNAAGQDGTAHGNIGSSANYWNGVYYKSLNKVSDKRKKRDLGNLGLEEALMILNQTRTVKYSMLDESEDMIQYGVFAQDIRDMLRDSNLGYRTVLNIGLMDGSEETTTNLYESEERVSYSIDYTQFIAPLIKGWQYHEQLIDDLREEIKQLKQQLNA